MSTTETMQTNSPDVILVEPNIERDAPLGVAWLKGELGRATLTSMGVPDKDNKPTTLEFERERVRGFIEKQDQLNWMIEHQGKVIGAIWADLEQVGNVPAPAIHIMIGDPTMRGKGVGFAAVSRVTEYFEGLGFENIYSRHLVKNSSANGLLVATGFTKLGEPYLDTDDLEWQNMVRASTQDEV